jgi:hypothetical protein
MKTAIAALIFSFALSPLAFAQEQKTPSPAQKKQQQRMKDCNEQAGDMKGDERKAFMSKCLKSSASGASAAQKKQQGRMTACNKQATEKKLKGAERKDFMSSCLKS